MQGYVYEENMNKIQPYIKYGKTVENLKFVSICIY